MELARITYDILWGLAVLGWLAIRLLRGKRPAGRSVGERLGRLPSRPEGAPVAVWLHAVSLGEFLSARPVLAALKQRRPDWWLLLSVSHPQAYSLAIAQPGDADAVCLLPWDFRPCVRAALNRARPDFLVLVECELWPNLILEAARRHTRVVMLNARIYERDLPGYLLGRPLFRRLLRAMKFIGAQSEADRDRFLRLGAPADLVQVAGSTKFDVGPSADLTRQTAGLRRLLPLGPGPLWVLASTHAGEEEQILCRLGPLRHRFPQLQLVIAPRHIIRAGAVQELARRQGLEAVLRTELPGAASTASRPGPPDVIVLDTVGELAAALGLADLVFVGGSLVDRGGHNPIEAARHSRAILLGPSVFNFEKIVAAFRADDAVWVVRDVQDLMAKAGELLDDAAGREALGRRAAAVVLRHAGAARLFVRCLEQFAPPPELGLWPTASPA